MPDGHPSRTIWESSACVDYFCGTFTITFQDLHPFSFYNEVPILDRLSCFIKIGMID